MVRGTGGLRVRFRSGNPPVSVPVLVLTGGATITGAGGVCARFGAEGLVTIVPAAVDPRSLSDASATPGRGGVGLRFGPNSPLGNSMVAFRSGEGLATDAGGP